MNKMMPFPSQDYIDERQLQHLRVFRDTCNRATVSLEKLQGPIDLVSFIGLKYSTLKKHIGNIAIYPFNKS